ncbi:MAG: hypothetical protein FWE62_05885 [Firmicutes bacterium]|nr:hypothetical protein [Bacillota bacterium]
MKILLKGGTAVVNGKSAKRDIYIDGKKISAPYQKADKIVDCAGMFVLAGLIDMHCHLRERRQR